MKSQLDKSIELLNKFLSTSSNSIDDVIVRIKKPNVASPKLVFNGCFDEKYEITQYINARVNFFIEFGNIGHLEGCGMVELDKETAIEFVKELNRLIAKMD